MNYYQKELITFVITNIKQFVMESNYKALEAVAMAIVDHIDSPENRRLAFTIIEGGQK